jgi:hypothetical protein
MEGMTGRKGRERADRKIGKGEGKGTGTQTVKERKEAYPSDFPVPVVVDIVDRSSLDGLVVVVW